MVEQSRPGISKTSTGCSRCVSYLSIFSNFGEHRYSLAADSLEISVLFRDWINGERRSYGHPPLSTKFENDVDEIMQDFAMEKLANQPIPEHISNYFAMPTLQKIFGLMPVAKLNTGGTPDAKKIADQVNNSLDTFIRQAMGKEPLPRTGEGPVQWMQWLHSMDQPDITGWSLSNPSNLKMQKCEKCSREFCSPINHRRHIRLHRRSSNSDKESQKYRDFLGAFWDKLSVDEVKEVVSLQDISLKETSGSALVQALATALGKPAIWSLPRVYIKAGSKLLEVIQPKPSRLPVTAEELFSILDDASERTFLCVGTAESVEKYVFDGEADKIGFDSKNLVACTSFLFEQKLVKACADEKNAEALRCQRLLFEEEEAAKKKHAEQLERKKVKKLRQKEQKAREQLNEEKGNLEVPADCFEVPLAEVHSVPGPSDSNYDIPDVSLNVSTCVKLVQFSSNEDMSVESQCDLSHQHLDSVKVHDGEPRPVSANSRRLSANAEWQAPKSQRFGRNGSNQNHQAKVEPLQKHKDSVSPVNSRKIWTRKVSVESDDASILEVQKEAIDQKQRSSEVMIGSLSISVKDWSTGRQGNCPVEAGAGSTEPAMPKKCNIVEKPAKHNAFQIGSNRVAAKLYMPVRHEVGRQDPEEGVISLKFDDRTSLHENPLQSCPMDSSGTHKNCQVPDGNAHQGWGFSISVAKAFLAQRWKEAITGDHVMLMRCPDTKFSERPEVPSSSSEIAPTLDSGEDSAVSSVDDLLPKDGVVQSSSSRKNKFLAIAAEVPFYQWPSVRVLNKESSREVASCLIPSKFESTQHCFSQACAPYNFVVMR
ncbi:hypothetical protein KY290_030059 [Solanum tuberosum]|uniref:C2H2-type domain-containing protein n=1 Tax=Solanum tuberosum TaxID=4113 RepID=A0ABQ7UMH9_SOLTU|nr:hypothetical protein KY290_030059 [Solanum tuberosum]